MIKILPYPRKWSRPELIYGNVNDSRLSVENILDSLEDESSGWLNADIYTLLHQKMPTALTRIQKKKDQQ